MQQSLARNSIYNTAYQFLNIVFPFITSIYVARVFGREIIGEVSYAHNFIIYFIAVVTSGLPSYGIREIARIRENPKDRNKLFTELFIINGIFTSIAFLAYMLFVLESRMLVPNVRLALVFSLLILWNYINVDWFYIGVEEFRYIAIRSAVIKVLSFVALIMLVRDKGDMYIYAVILSMGTGLNSVCNIVHLRRYIRFDFSRIELKGHLKVISILAINVFFDSLYSKSDITMLGMFSNKSEVGIYTYAFKIPDIVMVTCVSITAVFFPRLVSLYKEDKRRFLELVNQGIKIIFFITIPSTLGYIMVAPELFDLLYGEEFVASVPVTQLLSVMILIKCLGNLLAYQVVFCTGDEKKRIPVYIGAVIMNILLNLKLIPSLGAIGAAMASVTTEMALNTCIIIYEYRFVRFVFDLKCILKSVVAGAVMTAIVFGIKLIPVGQVMCLMLCISIGIMVYALMSIMLKNEMVDIIKSKMINSYIRD